MNIYFLMILLSNAFIGWLTIDLLVCFLYFKEKKIKKALISIAHHEAGEENILLTKWEEYDLAAEVEPVLDQRLDALVDHYRQQIPMSGMFLKGSLIEKVKTTAKDEILKALPDLKAKLMMKIENEFDLRKIIDEKIHHLSLKDVFKITFKKELFQVKVLATLLGFVIGLLEVIILGIITTVNR